MRNFLFAMTMVAGTAFAGSALAAAKGDIPVDQLPPDVKALVQQYVTILRAANGDPEKAAVDFIKIAGGGVVNPDGNALRQDVTRFSLKKDSENVKFYADPIVVTRVNVTDTTGHGFGASAIKGKFYKVWIQKADPKNGMPAPVGVIVPEGHPTIKTPKVDTIGSL